MVRRLNDYPGGERPGQLKRLPVIVASLAIGAFNHAASAEATPGQPTNELVQRTHTTLIDIADTVGQLVRKNRPGISPPERIRYMKKEGEANATRYVLARVAINQAGKKSFNHMVIIVKDGQKLPVSTALLEGAKTYAYHQGEKFRHGTVLETFPGQGLTWMEKMTNTGKIPKSEGMHPLVNLPLHQQPDNLTRVYNGFIGDLRDFIEELKLPAA